MLFIVRADPCSVAVLLGKADVRRLKFLRFIRLIRAS